jgi:hypothetical protein
MVKLFLSSNFIDLISVHIFFRKKTKFYPIEKNDTKLTKGPELKAYKIEKYTIRKNM